MRAFKAQREGAAGCDLLGEPMIAREESSGTQRAVEEYLRRRNIAPEALRIVARMDNPESIKAGVSQGMGVSVISQPGDPGGDRCGQAAFV